AHLTQPEAVVLPGPAWCDRAACHGAYRALDPDAGVDVHYDRANYDECKDRVQHRSQADDVDREQVREVRPPHDHARDQQPDHHEDEHEEQQLLATVVAALFHDFIFTHVQHMARLTDPLPVPAGHEVVAEHARREHEEAQEH